MLLLALNAVFAGLFFTFARSAYRRAIPFLGAGWSAIRGEPDYHVNVESRRVISDGGRFLIGGMLWLASALFTIGFGFYFALEALRLYLA